jgi:tetratricopeptide (TPR) repeat protein
MRLLPLALAASVLSMPISRSYAQDPRPPQTQRQRRAEDKAIKAFTAQKYQEALDIYLDLYAEHRDPAYLFNIGRCFHRLGQPEKAIQSYKDYLARVKRLTADEEERTNSYIRELQGAVKPSPAEEEQQKREAAQKLEEENHRKESEELARQQKEQDTQRLAERQRQDDRRSEHTALMRRAGVASFVAAGTFAVVSVGFAAGSWSKYGDSKNGMCLSGGPSNCSIAADAISTRNTWAVVFGLAAVASAAAGSALLFYLYPNQEPRHASLDGLSAGAVLRF